jgi:hypothetical protein
VQDSYLHSGKLLQCKLPGVAWGMPGGCQEDAMPGGCVHGDAWDAWRCIGDALGFTDVQDSYLHSGKFSSMQTF